MTEPVSASENRDEMIFILVSVVLIGNLLWRAFMPASEYPMRTVQLMTMGFDVALIGGLISMKSRVPKLQTLFWIALAAGLGLFVIRLTGDASWWTGHLMYRI
jgi:hypothetical protein